MSPEGLLLVDKPPGPTSHDVVDAVRKGLRQRRVGHAGTLDPFASGLLPLVLGRATRLVRFLPHAPKTYEGVLRLGTATSTDDLTGDIVQREALPPRNAVLAAAARFRGRLLQVPPAFSAKRIRGRRMYRLARAGHAPVAPPSAVEVFRFELEPGDGDEDWSFVAEVSAGTYIRALARDLGKELGCGGTLVRLRRVAIGSLSLDSAIPIPGAGTPPSWERLLAAVIPLEAMPLQLPSLHLDDAALARRFAAGLAVPCAADARDGASALFDPAGTLLGVAEVIAGQARPMVVLPGPPGPEEPVGPRPPRRPRGGRGASAGGGF